MKETVHRFWYNLVKNQLRFRVWIILLLVVLTGAFSWKIYTGLKVETNFFELYPPKHAYIKLYKEFRKMFGSANVLSIILERTDGKDIYNPETLKKLDELTRGILTVKGVNPLQVSSVSHPKIKQITTNAFGVGVFPLMYPAVGHPKTQQGADTFRKTVYGNAGVRGFYIALDDKSAAVYAGFWEEGLDFGYMFKAVRQLQDSVEDANHKCHISGYPMLYAWLDHYKTEVMAVLVVTLVSMTLLLAAYFRSLRGVLIPVISGALSGLWGLGFASMMGFNVDPLLLVVPVLLSARALSHSCQCMERYHQEYSIIGDNQKAIVSAYGALYPPALLAIVTDGLGVLTIAIATIPLMQKLAYVSSFWIISIFIGVAVVNPIILSYMKPPALDENIQVRNWLGKRKFSWWSRCYQSFVRLLHRLSGPRSKWVMGLIIVALVFGGGLFCADNLKIGDVFIPSVCQKTAHGIHPFLGHLRVCFTVCLKCFLPFGFGFSPCFKTLSEMFQCCIRHMKYVIFRDTEGFFGQTNLFFPQWRTVGIGGILLVGAPVCNMGSHNNQRRPLGLGFGRLEGIINGTDIISVINV